jgi:hypothetical protein
MLQRVLEHAGRLLPAGRRYPTERRVRGWFDQQRLTRADYAVVSFGKSGRTWVRVMMSRLYQLVYELRYEELLEFGNYHRRDRRIPRVLFTHDNYLRDYTLDGSSKRAYLGKRVVLLARHPADVTMSQYFQWKHRMRPHKVELNQYPRVSSGLDPYRFMMGPSGLPKVVAFLNEWAEALPTLEKSLVLRYEDLRTDTPRELRRLAQFLDLSPGDEIVQATVEYAAFENMKQREAEASSDSDRLRAKDVSNPDSFKTRRGKVGGWSDYFDDEQCETIDRVVEATLHPSYGYRASAPVAGVSTGGAAVSGAS